MPSKNKKNQKKTLKNIEGANDRFWDLQNNPKPTVDLVGKRRLQGKSRKKKKSRKRK